MYVVKYFVCPVYLMNVFVSRSQLFPKNLLWLASERASSSCSTSGNRWVTPFTNLATSHERRKDGIPITTNGTYPWSFMTVIIKRHTLSISRCKFISSHFLTTVVTFLYIHTKVRIDLWSLAEKMIPADYNKRTILLFDFIDDQIVK